MLEDLGWDIVPFSMQHPKNHPTPYAKYFIEDLDAHGEYSLLQKASRIPKVIYSFEARRKLEELLRVASPDSPYNQITSERMEARVVSETVDATNISSQRYSPARM